MRFLILRVGLIAAHLAIAAAADVISITSVKDNTLYEESEGSLSNGSGPVMFVGEVSTGGTRRALVEFDIAASIPAGSTINSATLRLYCSRTIVSTRRIALHRALQEWGEGASEAGSDTSGGGGAGAPSAPGDATWIHTFYPSGLWTQPGGDFSVFSSAETNVGGVGFYNWSSSGTTSDVQAWLDDPASNHGWLLAGVEDGARSAKRFNTRESSNPARLPTLVIDYTPIPEPATGLACLAAAAFLRRRV